MIFYYYRFNRRHLSWSQREIRDHLFSKGMIFILMSTVQPCMFVFTIVIFKSKCCHAINQLIVLNKQWIEPRTHPRPTFWIIIISLTYGRIHLRIHYSRTLELLWGFTKWFLEDSTAKFRLVLVHLLNDQMEIWQQSLYIHHHEYSTQPCKSSNG